MLRLSRDIPLIIGGKMIDYEHFTPIQSFGGGILIGIAVSLLLIINGRIAGISGIIAGLLSRPSKDTIWRIIFLFGLLLAPISYQFNFTLPEINVEANGILLIISGLLVGIGTRLGGGCTSGHGICGLSRFSLRSIIATLSFMITGAISVYLMRHFF